MRFSIIIPHYQGSITHEDFCRGIQSIKDQWFTDYEIICLHDGPLLNEEVDFPCEVQFLEQRVGDWGHTLRNVGIEQASGEYIIHFNPDNVLRMNALAELDRRITLDKNPNIVIFMANMMGLHKDWDNQTLSYPTKDGKRDLSISHVLTGYPCGYGNIDCMQLVMKTELWKKETWWDCSEQGDGRMYPRLYEKYGASYVYKVLGDHY